MRKGGPEGSTGGGEGMGRLPDSSGAGRILLVEQGDEGFADDSAVVEDSDSRDPNRDSAPEHGIPTPAVITAGHDVPGFTRVADRDKLHQTLATLEGKSPDFIDEAEQQLRKRDLIADKTTPESVTDDVTYALHNARYPVDHKAAALESSLRTESSILRGSSAEAALALLNVPFKVDLKVQEGESIAGLQQAAQEAARLARDIDTQRKDKAPASMSAERAREVIHAARHAAARPPEPPESPPPAPDVQPPPTAREVKDTHTMPESPSATLETTQTVEGSSAEKSELTQQLEAIVEATRTSEAAEKIAGPTPEQAASDQEARAQQAREALAGTTTAETTSADTATAPTGQEAQPQGPAGFSERMAASKAAIEAAKEARRADVAARRAQTTAELPANQAAEATTATPDVTIVHGTSGAPKPTDIPGVAPKNERPTAGEPSPATSPGAAAETQAAGPTEAVPAPSTKAAAAESSQPETKPTATRSAEAVRPSAAPPIDLREPEADRIARAEQTMREQRQQELREAGRQSVLNPNSKRQPERSTATVSEHAEALAANTYIDQQGTLQDVTTARAGLEAAQTGVASAEAKRQDAVDKERTARTIKKYESNVAASLQTEQEAAAALVQRRAELNSVVQDAAVFAEGAVEAARVQSVDEARDMADAENTYRLKEQHAQEGLRTGDAVAQRRAERGGSAFAAEQLLKPVDFAKEADAAGERAREQYRQRLDAMVASTINQRGKGADMRGEELKYVEDVRHDLGVDTIPVRSVKSGESQLQYFTSHEPSVNGVPGKKSDIIMVERRDLKTGKLLAAVTINQPGLLTESTRGVFRRKSESKPTAELARIMKDSSIMMEAADGGIAPLTEAERQAVSGDSLRYSLQDKRPQSEQSGANAYSYEDARGYDMAAWTAAQRGASPQQLAESGLKAPVANRRSWWQRLTNTGGPKSGKPPKV